MTGLLRFLWDRKLYWMLPMALTLLAIALLIALTESSTVPPFIYTLFWAAAYSVRGRCRASGFCAGTSSVGGADSASTCRFGTFGVFARGDGGGVACTSGAAASPVSD